MNFEVGDTVVWDDCRNDPGIIQQFEGGLMSIKWARAGLLKYSEDYWYRLSVIEKNNNKTPEFKTIQVVKLEDYTGTVVEYKGRKYKLNLVEQ